MVRFGRFHKAGAILLALAALLLISRTGAVAQAVRAALVRDVDNPALAPYRQYFEVSWTALQDDVLVTTVPAGKRLVIEHLSYRTGSTGNDEFTAGMLRNGYYLTNAAILLEVHPPHASWNGVGYTEQDGSQAVKAYFEPGTEIWLRIFHNTNNSRYLELTLNGYYVTP